MTNGDDKKFQREWMTTTRMTIDKDDKEMTEKRDKSGIIFTAAGAERGGL